MTNAFMLVTGVIGCFCLIGMFISACEKIREFLYRLASKEDVTDVQISPAVKQARAEVASQVKTFQKVKNGGAEFGAADISPSAFVKSTSDGKSELVPFVGYSDYKGELDPNGCDDSVIVKAGKHVVYCRQYKKQNVITRSVSFGDNKLRRRLGRVSLPRLALNDVDFRLAKFDISRMTRHELADLLKEFVDGNQIQPKKSPELKVDLGEKKVAEVPVSKTANNVDSPIQETDHTVARDKAKSIMKGVLRWHGVSDRVQGDKTFKHYRLDYLDDESKLVETVWGEDLKRAISSVNAKKGDYIEIFKLAKKRIDSEKDSEEKRFMNRWHIVVLKKS